MELENQRFTPYMQEMVRDTASKFDLAYCREDLLEDHQDMLRMKHSSAYPSRKKDLIGHLRDCGIDCPDDVSDAALPALIAGVPSRMALTQQLFAELYAIYEKFPTSLDYMERLVRRLGDPAFRGDSLRLAILKQFMKYTAYYTKAVQRLAQQKYQLTDHQAMDMDTLLGAIGEDIFDILEGTSKDAKDKYALLLLADRLALGKFTTQGGTKTDLYLFAFAFGMTASIRALGETVSEDTDIEKNLFSDYYQHDLLRYISGDFDSARQNAAEPTGEGINPKSFSEIIYLYYLRRQDLSRKDRLKKANQLIKACVDQAAEAPRPAAGKAYRFSRDYWSQGLKDIWNANEKDLVKYLCANYHIPGDARQKAKITIGWEERTAFDEYVRILDELDAFLDPGVFSEKLISVDAASHPGSGSDAAPADPRFRALLEKMGQMLSPQIPQPSTVLAKLLADRQMDPAAERVLALYVCLRKLRTLTFNALPEKNLFYDADREARALSGTDGSIGPVYALVHSIYQSMAKVLRRTDALKECAARAMDSFQKHTVYLRLHPDRALEFPTTTGCISKYADALRQTLHAARECAAALSGPLAELSAMLDRLEAAGTEYTDFVRGCRLAIEYNPLAEWMDHLAGIRPYADALLVWVGRADTPDTFEKLPDFDRMMKTERSKLNDWHRITRTSLIALAYHNYLMDADTERISMPELLSDFRAYMDPILERCRYQKISEKNLFDMFTVFSLYLKITLREEEKSPLR